MLIFDRPNFSLVVQSFFVSSLIHSFYEQEWAVNYHFKANFLIFITKSVFIGLLLDILQKYATEFSNHCFWPHSLLNVMKFTWMLSRKMRKYFFWNNGFQLFCSTDILLKLMTMVYFVLWIKYFPRNSFLKKSLLSDWGAIISDSAKMRHKLVKYGRIALLSNNCLCGYGASRCFRTIVCVNTVHCALVWRLQTNCSFLRLNMTEVSG